MFAMLSYIQFTSSHAISQAPAGTIWSYPRFHSPAATQCLIATNFLAAFWGKCMLQTSAQSWNFSAWLHFLWLYNHLVFTMVLTDANPVCQLQQHEHPDFSKWSHLKTLIAKNLFKLFF
ncbi:Hypothetical_protein [Hexamita inflata]|uniref:Hypothetical_protein n=1 Tax=Hexamita inflata TaxID=28002 RepID=A0AA86N903_9EUKA|nr:Hypothetical protein HINF_LOCUS2728 [Hexamita inflata]